MVEKLLLSLYVHCMYSALAVVDSLHCRMNIILSTTSHASYSCQIDKETF